MRDRAQYDEGGMIAVVALGIASIVVILVVEQVITQAPDPGTVDSVCMGLCNCGTCPPTFYALPIIAVLTILASYLVSFPKRVPDDEGRGES